MPTHSLDFYMTLPTTPMPTHVFIDMVYFIGDSPPDNCVEEISILDSSQDIKIDFKALSPEIREVICTRAEEVVGEYEAAADFCPVSLDWSEED